MKHFKYLNCIIFKLFKAVSTFGEKVFGVLSSTYYPFTDLQV